MLFPPPEKKRGLAQTRRNFSAFLPFSAFSVRFSGPQKGSVPAFFDFLPTLFSENCVFNFDPPIAFVTTEESVGRLNTKKHMKRKKHL